MAKKKTSNKKLESRSEFWLKPVDLAALNIAVVEVFRTGNAKMRAASIFNDAGALVEECRFQGDVSQDIPLQAGVHYRLAFRVKGTIGASWGFDIISRTSGQSLGSDNGNLGSSSESGQIGFTAR